MSLDLTSEIEIDETLDQLRSENKRLIELLDIERAEKLHYRELAENAAHLEPRTVDYSSNLRMIPKTLTKKQIRTRLEAQHRVLAQEKNRVNG